MYLERMSDEEWKLFENFLTTFVLYINVENGPVTWVTDWEHEIVLVCIKHAYTLKFANYIQFLLSIRLQWNRQMKPPCNFRIIIISTKTGTK